MFKFALHSFIIIIIIVIIIIINIMYNAKMLIFVTSGNHVQIRLSKLKKLKK